MVRAQLTDFTPARIGPYCGYSKSATVLQFRLLPGRDTVLVVIPCAREQGEAIYQNGSTYNLRLSTLATDPEWLEGGWQLSSAYEHRAWSRWWCRGLERVK
ncbi:hypothetical protein SAMN04515668_4948 [Hymenobacter arizonensis]|uniref:Uncharacterized protein n=1 Tax=Hymenobacter arizonensis TaxID=1227077 RepID=A0A1I6BQY3_HYMAR|nr:hypothetical protein SAMN04515668_4948 [Hymenobacter arizonensis]